MHFGHNNLKIDYSLDNKTLQKVHQEKDLGVIISNAMKSSLQCIQACCVEPTALLRGAHIM